MTLKLRKQSKIDASNVHTARTKKKSVRDKFRSSAKKRLKPKKGKRIGTNPENQCLQFIDGEQCKRKRILGDSFCRKHGGSSGKVAVKSPDNYLGNTNSNYDPKYHPNQFILLSSQQMSDVEIAEEFGISKVSMIAWADKYLEFSEAYEVGKTIEEAFYIRAGRNNLANPRFNTHLFKFMTGNRLGFVEKIESRNLNMNVSGVLKVPVQMDDAEWEDADFTVKDKEDK